MSKGFRFLPLIILIIFISSCTGRDEARIMTVKGYVKASKTGIWLTHEHVLVDFIGADNFTPDRYNRDSVLRKVLPYLREAKKMGCSTFAECTPEYLGRDPLLLKAISDSTGLKILTNVGLYGAMKNKYVPLPAAAMDAELMSYLWIKEWNEGIYDTGIKPGFIKIAVERDSLSDFHATIVRAAALTHLATGLTIASHTGPAIPAFQELEILRKEGVSPEAFIWVHAGNEKDLSRLSEAAKMGTWISIDKLNDKNVEEVVNTLKFMKSENLLGKVLVSHDAGWYDPGKPGGGEFRGFSTLFEKLVPSLKDAGFSDEDIDLLLHQNPAKAFTIGIRKIKS